MYDGALINGVVRINHLRSGEAEERADGDEDNTNRVVMNGASPLEVVVRSDRERGPDISFPKGGEGHRLQLLFPHGSWGMQRDRIPWTMGHAMLYNALYNP